MSWASRRRATYLGGVVLFFLVLVGTPIAYFIFTIPATCFDGLQNQGETAIDEGGPCLKLDPNTLQPESTLWARSFKVRDGSYTAIAYLVNPNANAGVSLVHYRFGLYDDKNVLVAERLGTAYVMPGGITPVFEPGIDTGNRIAVHTYFQIQDKSLNWQRMENPASVIRVSDQAISNTDSVPRVTAHVQNISYATLQNVKFTAVVFDPSGNAIAASATALPSLPPSTPLSITFTWPEAFSSQVGRIDVIPLLPPEVVQPSGQR